MVYKRLLEIDASNADDMGRICVDDYTERFPELSTSELDGCLEFLEHHGVIEIIHYQDSDCVYGVYITHKGRHYEEVVRQEKREFWRKSVYVPIIVAFVTAILTQYILPPLVTGLISLLQSMTK
jgi:hypothetical protein